jgi:branched-chain amino acid transport system permease protein
VFDLYSQYHFFIDVTLIRLVLVISVFVAFQAGLFSLASVGFMAIGGYTSALLVTKTGAPLLLAILAGVVVAILMALFISPVLRLRGTSLALATLAFSQVVVVIIGGVSFFGGQLGINVFATKLDSSIVVVSVIVACLVAQRIHRSHYRRALWGLRVDENTAAGLGVGVRTTSLMLFLVSAAVGGLAGGLDAFHSGLVLPEAYNFDLVVLGLTYVMVGGFGHWSGAILAAVVGEVIKQALHTSGGIWTNLAYGCVLIIVMMVVPNGITDPRVWRRVGRRLRPGGGPDSEPPLPAAIAPALVGDTTRSGSEAS